MKRLQADSDQDADNELSDEIGFPMDKVLIVDGKGDVLEDLAKGLERYNSQFKVLTAPDGGEAIRILSEESISLVVTDLIMPQVSGTQLIAYMSQNNPSTPVIIKIEQSDGDACGLFDSKGVLRCLKAPFNLKELADAIIDGLDFLDEGGSLNGIGAVDFLPLIELAKETCLLKIESVSGGTGSFYFDKGVIFDASCKNMKPEQAALEMLNWEKVQINFLPIPEKKVEKRLFSDLNALISKSGGGQKRKEQVENGVSDLVRMDPLNLGVSETPSAEVKEARSVENDVIIEAEAFGVIEEDTFLEIRPDREKAFRKKLNEFKNMDGFLGIGIFSSGGELISGSWEGPGGLARIGDYVFDVIRRAGRMLRVMEYGECDLVEITAKNGEHFLIRYFSIEGVDFLVLLICSPKSETAVFKRGLKNIAAKMTEDFMLR